jgi:hypothetical protein
MLGAELAVAWPIIMRFSVVDYTTTAADIDHAAAAVLKAYDLTLAKSSPGDRMVPRPDVDR